MAARAPIRLDASLRSEYRKLFDSCEISPKRKALVTAAARRVLASKVRYQAVGAVTRVPWFVVGAIHDMESGCNFERHLHNGDPVSAPTVHIPKGRPPGKGPFAWETSAVDAMELKRFGDWTDWSIPGTLFKLEGYNGFGYRRLREPIPSPYLWSFTSHYTKGKYRADGQFDPDLVSAQVGVAALFKELERLDETPLWPETTGPGLDAPAGPSRPRYPGRLIRRGEGQRDLVAAIQKQLVAAGCGPIDEEGEFGVETEASVRLFQSRNVDRTGAPLEIDGIIGPNTWGALFGAASVTTVEPHEQTDRLLSEALAVAASQIGVTEAPPFENTGKEVAEYLKSVGLGPGYAWCAAFVHWCFEQAARRLDIPNPVVRTGGCLKHWQDAGKLSVHRIPSSRAIEDPSILHPGHVFIMDHGGGKGHTGIVESVQGGLLVTIEGNTNPGGGREGDGVYRRTQRTLRSINVGYIDYSGSTPVDPTEPRPGGTGDTTVPTPRPTSGALADVAALVPGASSGGLLLKAVQQGAFEPPQWVDVPYKGLILTVGAHTLRAQVGGRLLRLPVCYSDVIAICNQLGWVPPTSAISDAIWRAAAVQVPPHTLGKWRTDAEKRESSRKMKTLEWVVKVNDLIDADLRSRPRDKLTSSEGKDWILSPRNLLPPREGGSRGAQTYGWHQLPDGEPIQDAGDDRVSPFHSDAHFDYSQTLRPIRRLARRPDGTPVDLLKVILDEGMDPRVLAPFQPPPRPAAPATPRREKAAGPKSARRGRKAAREPAEAV